MADKIIYRGADTYIPDTELLALFNEYVYSDTAREIEMYSEYYEGENCGIEARFRSRAARGKTPNNKIPTAYFSSVVDSMAGFMFSDIDYVEKAPEDAEYITELKAILDVNNAEVKDMTSGVNALAYNHSYELVYTTGDKTNTNIRFATISPEEMFCIYNNTIEPEMIAGVRYLESTDKDFDYDIDVIYATSWKRYRIKKGAAGKAEKIVLIDEKPLLFPVCPVIEYNAEVITENGPFAVIVPYIDALDVLLSGNSNEVDRVNDALLVIGKLLKEDDLKHLDEVKALMGFKNEDRAEFIQKNLDPAFREYVSKLLITEIYRHSHCVDWFGTDAISGDVSAKALRTRLHDMEVYSNRIKNVYRTGARKRVFLITYVMSLLKMPVGNCEIVFNLTMPNDMEDKIAVLNNCTYLSTHTKVELSGVDWSTEEGRLEEEKAAMPQMDITGLFDNQPTVNENADNGVNE